VRRASATGVTPAEDDLPVAWDENWDGTIPAEELDLKTRLLEAFYGTDRGLAATSETRAEINELISQLEAGNPTESPADALELLSGTWELAYTSNSEIFLLLAAGRLPLLEIGAITQSIDAESMTVENKVEFTAPLIKSAVSASAAVEVRSPKRLEVRFVSGAVAVPTLVNDIALALPKELEVMGQAVDLAPLEAALEPVQRQLQSTLATVSSALKEQTPEGGDLSFAIDASLQQETWLLTTYLDDSLRVCRGDGGAIFVLTKQEAPPEEAPEEIELEPEASAPAPPPPADMDPIDVEPSAPSNP